MIPICPVVSFTYGKGTNKDENMTLEGRTGRAGGCYISVLITFEFKKALFVVSYQHVIQRSDNVMRVFSGC